MSEGTPSVEMPGREGILPVRRSGALHGGAPWRGNILMFELVSLRQESQFLYRTSRVIGVGVWVGDTRLVLRRDLRFDVGLPRADDIWDA